MKSINAIKYKAKDIDEGNPSAPPTITERTFSNVLERTLTDGIVILHKGKIVYEKYYDGQTDCTRHILFSATKSFMGITAAVLVQDGKLDPSKLVIDYVPEMKSSALSDATVRQVMDMSVEFKYEEGKSSII